MIIGGKNRPTPTTHRYSNIPMTSPSPQETVILLGGPTASGKTSLALDMADRIGGAIINADAVQLYEDFKILSARPNDADMDRAPHHLYGILPSNYQTTVAFWQDQALNHITACHALNQIPILVGGTGFYLKVIQNGLPFIPPVPLDVQNHIESVLTNHGSVHLHGLLMAVDDGVARRIHPHDTQRIMRAYGVFISSGKPLSHWQKQPGGQPLKEYAIVNYVLLPDKNILATRAQERLKKMFNSGAVDEVAAFMPHAHANAPTVRKTLGVSEITAYLNGTLTRDQAFDQTLRTTMQYIKRQRTWFKTQQSPGTNILNASSSDWYSPLGQLC